MSNKKNIKQSKLFELRDENLEITPILPDFLFEEKENHHSVQEWNSMGFQVISFSPAGEVAKQQENNF